MPVPLVSMLPLPMATALGALRGATEIFPVSSDGHLALAQMLFSAESSRAFAAAARGGVLGATLLVLRKRARWSLEEGLRGLMRPPLWRETPGGRDAIVVAIATVPSAVIGVSLRHSAETWCASPAVIGGCLLLSAAALASVSVTSAVRRPGTCEREVPSLKGALAVGLAQGASVLPGLSRTAMTLAALLWLGVRADRAFELAFLMAIPVLAGTSLFDALDAGAAGASFAREAPALIAGAVAAFVVGLVALLSLRRIVAGGKVALFAFYLVPLAIATLAWGYARP